MLAQAAAVTAVLVVTVVSGHSAVADDALSPFSTQRADSLIHPSKLKTLYDQNVDDSGASTPSQETGDAFSAYAADDFTVPAGTEWSIEEVDVTGVYLNGAGLANSETVLFHLDDHGLPGTKIGEFDNLSGIDNGDGSFRILLPLSANVYSGRHWISVYTNVVSGQGSWGWKNGKHFLKKPAVWVNPGNGFGTGCVRPKRERKCFSGTPGVHMFR